MIEYSTTARKIDDVVDDDATMNEIFQHFNIKILIWKSRGSWGHCSNRRQFVFYKILAVQKKDFSTGELFVVDIPKIQKEAADRIVT